MGENGISGWFQFAFSDSSEDSGSFSQLHVNILCPFSCWAPCLSPHLICRSFTDTLEVL